MSGRLTAIISLMAAALPFTPVASADIDTRRGGPDRAIGRIYQEWLDTFNAGDPARLKDFYRRYVGDTNPVFALENAEDSCGLTAARTVARSPKAMTVVFRQRCLPGLQRLTLEVEPDGRPRLTKLELMPLRLSEAEAIAATVAIAERLARRNEFAGSLIVQRGGRRLVARSWGMTNPVTHVPMSLDTPMFLASAGKMFTGVAVLQLVEAGKIDLDAPLGRYLTGYPNTEMAKVTIRQLLTHRGGAGEPGILAREEGGNRARVRTIADIIRLNGSRAPAFAPGSKTEYSSYGFILLGAIVERVTGGSYYDYVAEHIFKPAGMKNAGFPTRQHLHDVAVGYTYFYGAETELAPNLDVLPWRGTPAGGGVASANDMRRFFEAMRAGKLLSPAMFNMAMSAANGPWGLGFVAVSGKNPSWGHGGNSYGMDVATHFYPGIDTDFICLASRDMVCNRLINAWYLRIFGPTD